MNIYRFKKFEYRKDKAGSKGSYYACSKEEEKEMVKKVEDCFRNKVHGVAFQSTVQVVEGLQVTLLESSHRRGGAVVKMQTAGGLWVFALDGYRWDSIETRMGDGQRMEKVDCMIVSCGCRVAVSETKRRMEMEFCKRVVDVVSSGGKVFVPSYSIGAVDVLYPILRDYVKCMDVKVKWWTESVEIYEKYGEIKVAKEFKNGGVWFGGGMLCAGSNGFEIFKGIAGDDRNLVVLSEYCGVRDTMNYDLLHGLKHSRWSKKMENVKVNCQVHYVPYDDEMDMRTMVQLSRMLNPKHVFMMNGKNGKVKNYVDANVLQVNSAMSKLSVLVEGNIPANISRDALAGMIPRRKIQNKQNEWDRIRDASKSNLLLHAILVSSRNKPLLVVNPIQFSTLTKIPQHQLNYVVTNVHKNMENTTSGMDFLLSAAKMNTQTIKHENAEITCSNTKETISILQTIATIILKWLPDELCVVQDNELQIRSIRMAITTNGKIHVSWQHVDDKLATRVKWMAQHVLHEMQPSQPTPPPNANSSNKRAIW